MDWKAAQAQTYSSKNIRRTNSRGRKRVCERLISSWSCRRQTPAGVITSVWFTVCFPVYGRLLIGWRLDQEIYKVYNEVNNELKERQSWGFDFNHRNTSTETAFVLETGSPFLSSGRQHIPHNINTRHQSSEEASKKFIMHQKLCAVLHWACVHAPQPSGAKKDHVLFSLIPYHLSEQL